MSLPMLHAKTHLTEFTEHGSWDALILVLSDDLEMMDEPWSSFIQQQQAFDRATQKGIHLLHCPLAPDSRLILCQLGSLDYECFDQRVLTQATAKAMRRALDSGAQRPCFQLCLPDQYQTVESLEASLFGALSALWQPLEAREQAKGGSIEALAVVTDRIEMLTSDFARASWLKWLTAVELGRSIARDITGTEPERMAPPKLADYCKKIFKGTNLELDIIKDRTVLEKEYPLLSAVARASWAVPRHHPRVIKLKYIGDPHSQKLICLAGKGVCYDTGGTDLKPSGSMAGMSRDKGGAGAVIGLMYAVSQLEPKLNFVAEIGAVRNSIGADSFVTDEIIMSHGGQRVRIGNTDAEGRLVLSDLLSHLRDEITDPQQAHLMSIATLTGHAYRAVGPFTIAIDNQAARQHSEHKLFDAVSFQEAAEAVGEGVELSRLRQEDFDMVAPKTLSEDLISANNLPTSATARGHQFPAAFLIQASGLSAQGLKKQDYDQKAYRFTHIDIGGSGVEGGDWQHGRPSAAPVLGLAKRLIPYHLSVIMLCCIVSAFFHTEALAQQALASAPMLRTTALQENEAMGTGGMVVADNQTASQIGVDMLKAGGDAADAAVATALALGVLQPFASGIGGGGFAVVYRGEQRYALDFREVAPAAATADMYLDLKGKPVKGKSTIGALAAGVPGEIAGLFELHKRHGKLPWATVVKPAQKLAQEGFPMHKLLHKQALNYLDRIKYSPQLSQALLQNGQVKALGEMIYFPELAHTLKLVAEQGAQGFYQGKVAQELVDAVQKAGGIITAQDLSSYKVKERAVLEGWYQGYQILSMPPPSSGGLVIIQALKSFGKLLGKKKPEDLGRDSGLYLHMLVEVLKHAFADRAEYMGDPDFYPVPTEKLLADERINEIVALYYRDKTLETTAYGMRSQVPKDGGTSHLNVIDGQGHAIALTTTINTGFGSRFVAGNTGVLLNNEMDDFIMKPGVPNAYGLIGKASNAVQAFKRPLSSMSPTIILKDQRVVGLVGASGGPTIITGTIQALLNLIHFDGEQGEVGRAVSAPRIHHQWIPEILHYDQGLPTKTIKSLLARQHTVKQWPQRFTSVQALWVLSSESNETESTILIGASDPSKLGTPAVVLPFTR